MGETMGQGGKPVFLTNVPVDKPLRPFDDDERCLIEHGCIKASQQQWRLKHPPQKTVRAVRVHVLFTLLMFALATAYRLPCQPADRRKEPVGLQHWRRQLLVQTCDHAIVCAQHDDGILPMAEYSRLLGVKLTDGPRGIGMRWAILAKLGSQRMADLISSC
jgi:hypothetical protein